MVDKEREEMSSNLLASIDEMKLQVSMDGISKRDLDKYAAKLLKENYVKPFRLSGRKSDQEEKYTIPMGIFHLGDSSFVPMDKDDDKPDEEYEDIETHNYLKMVDGKLVVTDEEQEEDAEEQLIEYNLKAKRDIPYQIYHTIYRSGRRTIEELYERFSAIEKPLFLIIVNQMLNKGYLKKVKETDRDIVFKDDENMSIKDMYEVVEKEIETLEVVGENERRLVLEEKK